MGRKRIKKAPSLLGCNKKVSETMSGKFTCEKCNKEYDSCHRRYILSVQMADYTGNGWFSLFNDAAEKLLGCPAQTLFELRSDMNEAAYEKIFSDALFKTFVCKVNMNIARCHVFTHSWTYLDCR